MIEQLKKNFKYQAALLLIMLLVGFYWFQLRPSLIRQDCQEYARKMGNDYWRFDYIQKEKPLKRGQLQAEYMEGVYNRCLHDKGL